MRILVSNDDGINSLGLKILAKKAQQYGEVIVIAPKVEQSGRSHAINIHKGLFFQKLDDLIPGVDTYLIDSTPADCIRFAHYYLKDQFDLVFAGINNGLNLGEDIMYSGTVACASEAVFIGKKGIAFSTKRNDFSEAELRFDDIMKFIFDKQLFDYAPLYNVNIPLASIGIKITHQGHTHYDTTFELENNLVYQRGKYRFELDNDSNSDVTAYHEHFISITPLSVDRTDRVAFKKIINL